MTAHNFIDMTGKHFRRLVVLELCNYKHGEQTVWHVRCDCGNELDVQGTNLRTGNTTSCGCYKKDRAIEANITHGLSKTSAYKSYNGMKGRCTNPNDAQWRHYGGRGITICDRWLESFENFWEDMGECEKGMSLERIDVNGNYCPENCIWIPRNQQIWNRRNTLYVNFHDEKISLGKLAHEFGIDYHLLWRRTQVRGWSLDKAISKGVK